MNLQKAYTELSELEAGLDYAIRNNPKSITIKPIPIGIILYPKSLSLKGINATFTNNADMRKVILKEIKRQNNNAIEIFKKEIKELKHKIDKELKKCST